jgi:hypothetical protein
MKVNTKKRIAKEILIFTSLSFLAIAIIGIFYFSKSIKETEKIEIDEQIHNNLDSLNNLGYGVSTAEDSLARKTVDNLKHLHNELIQDGYEVPEYDQFKKDMSNESNLLKVYNHLINDGYDLPAFSAFKFKMTADMLPSLSQLKLKSDINLIPIFQSNNQIELIDELFYKIKDYYDIEANSFHEKLKDENKKKILYKTLLDDGFTVPNFKIFSEKIDACNKLNEIKSSKIKRLILRKKILNEQKKEIEIALIKSDNILSNLLYIIPIVFLIVYSSRGIFLVVFWAIKTLKR